MTIRLLTLYLRGRRVGAVVAVVCASVVLRGILAPWTSDGGPFAVLLSFAVTIVAATAVAGGLAGPFGEVERPAGGLLPALRGSQLVGTSLIAGVGCAVAVAVRDQSVAGSLRDLAGFVGIALLTGLVFGADRCWSVPLGFALVCAGEVDLHQYPVWAWPVRPVTDTASVVIAALLLVLGVVLTVRSGPAGTGDDRLRPGGGRWRPPP
jgi:hypothetical protein